MNFGQLVSIQVNRDVSLPCDYCGMQENKRGAVFAIIPKPLGKKLLGLTCKMGLCAEHMDQFMTIGH